MVVFDRIRIFFDEIEYKTFYYYTIGYLNVCLLLSGLLVFYYYKNATFLQKKLKRINTTREDTIRAILESAQSIEQQRAAVEEILSQNPDFKIAGYFKDLLTKLNLKNKEIQEAETTSTTEREDNYR